MTKKFRIIVREAGRKTSRMFTIATADDTLTESKVLHYLREYMEAEQEHDDIENRNNVWVII